LRGLFALTFLEAEVEREFQAALARDARVFVRVATLALLVGWCAVGGIEDRLAGSPANERLFLLLRYALATPLLLGAAVVSWLPEAVFARLWRPTIVAAVATALGTVAAMAAFAPDGDAPRYSAMAFGCAILAGGSHALTCLPWRAATLATSPLVGLVIAVAVRSPDPAARIETVFWIAVTLPLASVTSLLLEVYRRRAFALTRALDAERALVDQLLHSALPASIVARLKGGATSIADLHDEATVLFADLVGFTTAAARVEPARLVRDLGAIFQCCDEVIERHGLTKIKTIGDAYMAVAGAPTADADHATHAADAALALRDAVAGLTIADQPACLRLGLSSGPVVAGVLGQHRIAYDAWGDTVNLASRLEAQGVAGQVQVSASTAARLGDRYVLEPRGCIELKGKGRVEAFLLKGRR